MAKKSWDDSQLKEVVENSRSIDEVLRHLNLTLNGGNRKSIRMGITRLNINISHFTRKQFKPVENIKRGFKLELVLKENSTYTNTHRLKLRLISEGIKIHKCENCNLSTWLNQKIPLELHHENGNNRDHRIENLKLLCPNCHALTESYRGKAVKI